MGDHRMFSLSLVDSDFFLDMPVSAQLLYYHLGMRADDEGFLGNTKRITRAVGCREKDFNTLSQRGLLINFDSGISAIAHWNVHNSIRKDRKKPTVYRAERDMLVLENDVYRLKTDAEAASECQPNDAEKSAQDKLSKDKLSKDKLSKDKLSKDKLSKDKLSKDKLSKDNKSQSLTPSSEDDGALEKYQQTINLFNNLCPDMPNVLRLTEERKRAIDEAERHLENSSFYALFSRAGKSGFLNEKGRSWGCGFDWIIKPENIVKILEGNYDSKKPQTHRRMSSFDIDALEEIV